MEKFEPVRFQEVETLPSKKQRMRLDRLVTEGRVRIGLRFDKINAAAVSRLIRVLEKDRKEGKI